MWDRFGVIFYFEIDLLVHYMWRRWITQWLEPFFVIQRLWVRVPLYILFNFTCRQESDRLKSIRTWERRPLDTLDTLKQLGIGTLQATPPLHLPIRRLLKLGSIVLTEF